MDLRDIIDVKYPIIQGGMANIATAEFAAAVSNAGGLGLIASGGLKPEGLRAEIEKIRTLTDKPFGVNLMLMNYHVQEMAEIIEEMRVPVVTTGAGNPGRYISMWKNKGSVVIPVIANPTMALKMERLGVDAVIAEGTEAGGHVGEMTTMTLIPQVKDRVNIPVIAAGGIANGRQMYAAEVLGAIGVQVGTMLLVADECPIHDNYKDRIIKAKDTHITVIGRIRGVPTRVIRNSMTNEYINKEKEGWDLEQLEVFTMGALRKAVQEGDMEQGSLMAGLVSPQINEKKPVKDIIEELYEDYLKVKERMCK
ncbi:MAG: enoyl-[acyl-carrier-protein] reductase FabK [Tissierellia bacterium]|nr:enoyl-[acyl-carrier-protein] reductase FabK [Tissierellia bacterium]